MLRTTPTKLVFSQEPAKPYFVRVAKSACFFAKKTVPVANLVGEIREIVAKCREILGGQSEPPPGQLATGVAKGEAKRRDGTLALAGGTSHRRPGAYGPGRRGPRVQAQPWPASPGQSRQDRHWLERAVR